MLHARGDAQERQDLRRPAAVPAAALLVAVAEQAVAHHAVRHAHALAPEVGGPVGGELHGAAPHPVEDAVLDREVVGLEEVAEVGVAADASLHQDVVRGDGSVEEQETVSLGLRHGTVHRHRVAGYLHDPAAPPGGVEVVLAQFDRVADLRREVADSAGAGHAKPVGRLGHAVGGAVVEVVGVVVAERDGEVLVLAPAEGAGDVVSVRGAAREAFGQLVLRRRKAHVHHLPVVLLAAHRQAMPAAAPDVHVLQREMPVSVHRDAAQAVVVVQQTVGYSDGNLPHRAAVGLRVVVALVGGRHLRVGRRLHAGPDTERVGRDPGALRPLRVAEEDQAVGRRADEVATCRVHGGGRLQGRQRGVARVWTVQLHVEVRGVVVLLVHELVDAGADGGERVARPVPVHLEVAEHAALGARYHQIRAALPCGTAEDEHGAVSVEREVAQAFHAHAAAKAPVRAGRQVEPARAHALRLGEGARERGGVVVVRDGEPEVGGIQSGAAVGARPFDLERAGPDGQRPGRAAAVMRPRHVERGPRFGPDASRHHANQLDQDSTRVYHHRLLFADEFARG